MGGTCVKCFVNTSKTSPPKKTRSRLPSPGKSCGSTGVGVPGSSTASFANPTCIPDEDEDDDDDLCSKSENTWPLQGFWTPFSSDQRPSNETDTSNTSSPAGGECASILQFENDLFTVSDRDRGHSIVLVYGGPGSKKGQIVENLVQTYGFQLLSSEEIILKHLPPIIERRARREGLVFNTHHVMSSISNDDVSGDRPTWYTRGPFALNTILNIKRMLQDYPDELTLRWVLSAIADEICTRYPSKETNVLVDLLPNFQFLLDNPSFAVKDCSEELECFDTLFASVFALYLDVVEDNSSNHRASPLTVLHNDTNCVKSEIDKTKIQMRQSSFQALVKPHVEYFRNSRRLVTVNVSSFSFDHTWWHVNELFHSLLFTPRASNDVVIVFANGDHDVHVECGKTQSILRLQLDKKPYSSEDTFLQDFQEKVAASSSCNKALLVVCEVNWGNKLKMKKKKRIKFVENGDPFHRFVVQEGNHCIVQNRAGRRFKALSSPGNVVCCFPDVLDDGLCRQVAAHVGSMFQQRLIG